MSKRVLLIVAAVLLLAFLAYVGVSAANGSYTAAAGIGAQDVTAVREGSAVLARIQAAPGVKSATFAFTSGLIADRKSLLAAKMSSAASLADVRHVVDLARNEYNHGPGTAAGAVLSIDMPGAPALTLSSFSVSSAQLTSDLRAWNSIPQSTQTPISLDLGDSNRRTLAIVSGKGATFAWMTKHYAMLKMLAAEGFTWTNPGVCDLDRLPDESVITLMTKLAAIVPVASCNSTKPESGLVVAAGVPPAALLGFVKGSTMEPFSAHAGQFAHVTSVLLAPNAPNLNVGFFGVANGKLTIVRFFTGTCASGVVTHPDKEDAASLSILEAHGVDVAARATLGQCSPRPSTSSPQPAG